VQDDTEVNAFVTAGGKVVVYTGILQHLQTPERLAVILGHEIAHYVADHVAERKGIDWINMVLSEALEAKDSKWFQLETQEGKKKKKKEKMNTYPFFFFFFFFFFLLSATCRRWA
jgi:Zn-dependent protease with chaperone function